jgi:hypothetical protein
MSVTGMRCCRPIAVIAAALFFNATAGADAPLVYASIEPAQITLGESARYIITNLGKGTESISLPVVAGLDFQVIARSSQFELVNGTTLMSNVTIVRVTPQIAGIFTIPAITSKAQPLVLQVNADHATANASRSASGTQPAKPPIFSGASVPNGVRLTPDGSAYVRLEVPKREVYVGESVPVEIEIGMRSGFVSSLNGLPKLLGDDFTLNNLSRQPERTEKLIGGQPFVLMTWHSVLAVVKPGTFSLAAEVPLTIKIRTRPRSESALDDAFGDPFLQNFFGATISKEVDVQSPQSDLTVLALPTEGRPPDFHGAVGRFSIASDVSPVAAEAGEPLTLRMHVTGSGNFDRVDSNMLEHLDQWKTYPPKSSFIPTDTTGYKGEKTFEQPLIALKPGVQSVPALAFSYFDPTTRHYETTRSAPLSVSISPSLADSTLTAPETAPQSAATAAAASHSELRPDHAMIESSSGSLVPLYLQPRFLAIPSLMALALAGGWIGMRRRLAANEPVMGRGIAPRRINQMLAQIAAAARARDAPLFFNLSRTALQETLAARWQVSPDQITAAEIAARIGSEGEGILQLFALADESKYSPHPLNGADFVRWAQVVRHQLIGEKTR